MGIQNIRGLTPEAWEALKWLSGDSSAQAVVLKDDLKPNGNYERGEAYISANGVERKLTSAESEKFETAIVADLNLFPVSLEDLGVIGEALRTIVNGHGIEVTRSARLLSDFPFVSRFAEPLKRASDKNKDNAEIAFAAGLALFRRGEFVASVPYFLKANAYVNFEEPRAYLAFISFRMKDWGRLDQYLKPMGAEAKEAVKKNILGYGKELKVSEKPEEVLKVCYALYKFFPEKREYVAFVKLLAKTDISKLTTSYEEPTKREIAAMMGEKLKRGERTTPVVNEQPVRHGRKHRPDTVTPDTVTKGEQTWD